MNSTPHPHPRCSNLVSLDQREKSRTLFMGQRDDVWQFKNKIYY